MSRVTDGIECTCGDPNVLKQCPMHSRVSRRAVVEWSSGAYLFEDLESFTRAGIGIAPPLQTPDRSDPVVMNGVYWVPAGTWVEILYPEKSVGEAGIFLRTKVVVRTTGEVYFGEMAIQGLVRDNAETTTSTLRSILGNFMP
jgi:hypothetical protein